MITTYKVNHMKYSNMVIIVELRYKMIEMLQYPELILLTWNRVFNLKK